MTKNLRLYCFVSFTILSINYYMLYLLQYVECLINIIKKLGQGEVLYVSFVVSLYCVLFVISLKPWTLLHIWGVSRERFRRHSGGLWQTAADKQYVPYIIATNVCVVHINSDVWGGKMPCLVQSRLLGESVPHIKHMIPASSEPARAPRQRGKKKPSPQSSSSWGLKICFIPPSSFYSSSLALTVHNSPTLYPILVAAAV